MPSLGTRPKSVTPGSTVGDCFSCNKDISPVNNYFSCSICEVLAHASCMKIKEAEFDLVVSSWKCAKCRLAKDDTPIKARATLASKNAASKINKKKIKDDHEIPEGYNDEEESKAWHLWKYFEIFIAEFFGTGLLMFFGCMGSVSGFTNFVLPPLQGPVAFGLVVSSLIQAFGHLSAAHFNPAVTACFFMLGGLSVPMAITYFVAEMLGAVAGFSLLMILTPRKLFDDSCFCCTIPDGSLNEIQAIAIEFMATGLLVLTVCSVTDARNARNQDSSSLKFGALIMAISMAAGPYTGASMNPARTFAPALVNGVWSYHWVYWAGPMLAGFIIPTCYKIIFVKKLSSVTKPRSPLPQSPSAQP